MFFISRFTMLYNFIRYISMFIQSTLSLGCYFFLFLYNYYNYVINDFYQAERYVSTLNTIYDTTWPMLYILYEFTITEWIPKGHRERARRVSNQFYVSARNVDGYGWCVQFSLVPKMKIFFNAKFGLPDRPRMSRNPSTHFHCEQRIKKKGNRIAIHLRIKKLYENGY